MSFHFHLLYLLIRVEQALTNISVCEQITAEFFRMFAAESVCVSVEQLVLDAETVCMPDLPLSKGDVPGSVQGLFEVCVCPSGKLFLSKAGVTSTCSENQEC